MISIVVESFNVKWFSIFDYLFNFCNTIPVVFRIEPYVVLEPFLCLSEAVPVMFVILSNLHFHIVAFTLAFVEL